MLLVDSREPLDIQTSIEQPYRVVTLKAGDFLDPRVGLLIERKTPADLLASIADGRLYHQCATMVDLARYPVLLLHGSLLPNRHDKVVADGRVTRWYYWSVLMTLLSIQVGGVSLIHIPRNMLSTAIEKLQAWCRRNNHLVVKRPKSQWTRPSPALEILTILCGHGGRAKSLLDTYGTLHLSLAHMDDWADIKTIGTKTVSRARAILGGTSVNL